MDIQVYGGSLDELTFIRNALQALQGPSEIFAVNYGISLDLESADLRRTDVLILQGIDGMNGPIQQNIREFVRRGGHLIGFPGTVDSRLSDLDFLGIPAETATRIELDDESFQLMDPQSLQGTIWQYVLEPEIDNPVKFFAYIPQRPQGELTVGLENQDILWNRFAVMGGTVDRFGFAMDLNWTNFPIRGSFLPFWHVLLYSGREEGNGPAYAAGDSWSRVLLASELRHSITHFRPDGGSHILEPDERGLVKIARLKHAGFHEVRSGPNTLAQLAVNPPSAEIEGIELSDSALEEPFSGSLLILHEPGQIGSELRSARLGVEMWRWFLILLSVLMVLELLLANEYGHRQSKNN